MKDALGNEVVLGQKYGYSTTDTVFVGVAEHFTATRVTLLTVNRRMFIYGTEDLTWLEKYPPARTVSVASYHLFPVND